MLIHYLILRRLSPLFPQGSSGKPVVLAQGISATVLLKSDTSRNIGSFSYNFFDDQRGRPSPSLVASVAENDFVSAEGASLVLLDATPTLPRSFDVQTSLILSGINSARNFTLSLRFLANPCRSLPCLNGGICLDAGSTCRDLCAPELQSCESDAACRGSIDCLETSLALGYDQCDYGVSASAAVLRERLARVYMMPVHGA